ncbi:MAG: hypothetical protein HWE30_15445 [Methylocystaceae bacterium]|nr:hypothetical protein [Methylocystaceae bacterium]
MMIPASMTQVLLHSLLQDLITQTGEPDYVRYRLLEHIEKRYQAFLDVLKNSEDDLSIVHSLVEKDPDCLTGNPILRLQALVDYVEIAAAIYSEVEMHPNSLTIHKFFYF